MPLDEMYAVAHHNPYALDEATVSQYDLRTATGVRVGRKKSHVPTTVLSRSSSAVEKVGARRGVAAEASPSAEARSLRATLRPILQSTPNLQAAAASHHRRLSSLLPEKSATDLNARASQWTEAEEEDLAGLDVEDAEIARLGLKTGEDAVNYFTAATKDVEVKFVHLIPLAQAQALALATATTALSKGGVDLFVPYSLVVVPASVAVATGDYFTMSKSGLVHCVLHRGANATECLPMNEWVRHSTLFNLMRSIHFFKNFIPFKVFHAWRSNVSRQLYEKQRRRVAARLVLARSSFCGPLVEMKKEVFDMTKTALVACPRPRVAPDSLDQFLDLQLATRKEALATCEAAMKKVVEICAEACAAVQALDRNKVDSEDPRKRLDALVAAKLDFGGKNAKTRSMNAAVEGRKAQRRLTVRAAEDRAMLSDFVRLADTIMVETVVAHALHTFTDVVLADFTDPAHKVGLFDVVIGFTGPTASSQQQQQQQRQKNTRQRRKSSTTMMAAKKSKNGSPELASRTAGGKAPPQQGDEPAAEGTAAAEDGPEDNDDEDPAAAIQISFTPTAEDLVRGSSRAAHEIIQLLSRIPRVLDARGVAEHCSSGAGAAKFDVVINALPRFHAFVGDVSAKFLEDFETAAQRASAFDVIRPIYAAHLAFDKEAFLARARTFAEARAEFEETLAWQKELDKMRTRDSIGTIEVTSRHLRTTLTPFIEATQDALKGVIRDEARQQCRVVLERLKSRVRILQAEPSTLTEYAAYVATTRDYDEREMRRVRAPIDQMYALLQQNEVKLPPDDLVALDEMHTESAAYAESLAKATLLKEDRLQAQSEQLDREILALDAALLDLAAQCQRGDVFVNADYFHGDVEGLAVVKGEVAGMQQRLAAYTRQHETFKGYKELFGYASDELPSLKKATDQLALLEKLWGTVAEWLECYEAWTNGDLTKLDAVDVDRRLGVFQADAFRLHKKIPSDVTAAMLEAISQFQPMMALVNDLGNPAMLQRHWERLFKALKRSYDPSKAFTLSDFIAWGVADQADLVNETSATASGEAQLEKTLAKMEAAWAGATFTIKEWRTSHIIVAIDEIQQELDDQIVKTQAMRGSRFVKPFLKHVTTWETMLTDLQDIIDNWLKVQAAWLYLEPIFSSDDIMKQIPTEGRLFKLVNDTWRESMTQTLDQPAVLAATQRPDFKNQLVDANARLDRIQKGLNDYLETKRLAFPRFFFLSNDELLEILAETKDPTRVQPHLKKCFDGICNLEFTDRLDILACLDNPPGPKAERLEFAYEACKHRRINPRDSGGNVERWLVEVEAIMKKSLAHAIDEALADFHTTKRGDWLTKWQGQTVLTVNQVTWVEAVEAAFLDPDGYATQRLYEGRNAELLDVVVSVRGKIPKRLRETLGALVVMDVHNRDITADLAASNVAAKTDFDWQAQLRYYWHAGGDSALSGEPGTIECRMINAMILYAYEYIGNCGRLVVTPLTDRCYRTLMGAIHLNLGGAPEGPAGTGKTETTKDLGKAIAIQCVVTNCSDGLDYKAMGKFFKGLAASGAWARRRLLFEKVTRREGLGLGLGGRGDLFLFFGGVPHSTTPAPSSHAHVARKTALTCVSTQACFDEFNRIQLEVLSVIAQQVLTIQQAKARRAERFMFEGTDLPLKMTCCPFITMNPGYAGRAELPDNLKVLFRTVAMMVPDYAMIGEIILYSMGYKDAKAMAVKIVTTYKLCSEQLSAQSHYDYGMRAVIAVLRAAGNLKRAEADLPEDVLVLRSIIDVNLPKFLSPDVPLFGGITSDLFPGVELPPPDRAAMKAAFQRTCARRNLQAPAYFWEKVVQIYDMMVVRHGFMIVGGPFSGKTSAWKVLGETLGALHDEDPEDQRWSKVISFVMNPKSVTMGQLYGQFDPVSTEWTDGVLAINYRNAAHSKVGAAEDRKWVLLDGPVDAIWIENMNTVLDDNKKLCLMSGEIIAMSDVMSMIFEPMDLLVASPATVSRCGMIYMEPEQLGWQVILESWLHEWSEKKKAAPKPNEAPTSAMNANKGETKEEEEEDPAEEKGAAPPPDENKAFEGDEAVAKEDQKEEPAARRDFELREEEVARLRVLVQWLVQPCMCLVRRELKEVSPTVDSGLLNSLLNLLACLLAKAFSPWETTAAPGSSPREAVAATAKKNSPDDAERARLKHVESSFLFALIWSVGVTVSGEGRARFSAFLRALVRNVSVLDEDADYSGVKTLLAIKQWEKPSKVQGLHFECPLPEAGDAHDWCYSPAAGGGAGAWVAWIDTVDKSQSLGSDAEDVEFSQILVPTVCTTQISFLLTSMLPRGVRPLIVGPTGTGKSVCAARALVSELPQDKFKALTLGFSAKTSANMTQRIIDGQLMKRRKGVFGPPLGQTLVMFVDDMNMPEVETYGAQPPIELLRQLVDSGGYYDLVEKSWLSVVDTVILCAMGPPGGGRNGTTPRFLRHFNTLSFTEFNDSTLTLIFGTIVDRVLTRGGFAAPVLAAGSAVVDATLRTYREAMGALLPTPSKSHYTFNLRDFSRVVQGVLMADPGKVVDKAGLARLWTHEALRVFADRLTDAQNRDWFVGHARRMTSDVFELDFDDEFRHLASATAATGAAAAASSSSPTTTTTTTVGYADLRNLFFGNYMTGTDEDDRPYEEIRDIPALQATIDQYLMDFNAASRKPMDLVMFMFAIEHVSRIARVLSMPGGHALLVGVGGSGRQSVSILAAEIAGDGLRRIEISKNYGLTEWRDDLKVILRDAGTGPKPVVFLFSDTQIKAEAYVEDINNMLNSGEVPNIFANDEKVAICEAVRPLAKQQLGQKEAGAMTPVQLYAYFISRVKQRLHIVLAFSPIGDAFRDRLRLFPSLVNNCYIDWFTAWPGDALVAVADKFLAEVELDAALRPAITTSCQHFHLTITQLSEKFLAKAGRVNYVTPTSYLELIVAFKTALERKRAAVSASRDRYRNGLEQLASAESSVEKMQTELTALQPVLQQSQIDTENLMAEIEEKLPGVRQEEAVVGQEAEAAQEEANVVHKQVDEVQADLDEAIPALNEALKALDTIKPADIDEVRKLSKPPATVKLVAEAICVMLGEKPVKVPDPVDASKKVWDYWPTSQKVLNDKNFIARLKTYDKDNIPPKTIKELRDKYITDPSFTPENAKKASSACAGLCKWCYAMETYERVWKVVAPKKEKLRVQQEALAVTMAELDLKKASLRETQGNLKNLQDKLEASKREKADLSFQVDLCGKKLVRAKQLINDLGGEKIKWGGFVEDLTAAYTNLTGDVLVSAALMAYLGPFTSTYRDDQMRAWVAHCLAHRIPCSAASTLQATLGNPVQIREWISVDSLPTDDFSIDNAIIVFNARRWPLMIDPQGQANKWVRSMEAPNNIHVLKLTDDYMRTLENGIQFGQPVLLENVGEDLDPTLEPLLLKQIFKQGGLDCIRLGDSTVQYSEHFRFYMTTKLRNPHYLPETSVKVTLLNFMITPEGLADQLLGVVVQQERADLEKKKNELVVESALNARKLKDIEDMILGILAGEGNILENETAILTLGESKKTSDEIKEKQALAERTEKEIDDVRAGYKPVADDTQVLFFCITDLNNVEPTYSYSLPWFVHLFVASIQKSDKSPDIPTRLAKLMAHFEYALYKNVCRSLLEKDKLIFSFVMTVRKLAHGAKEEEKTTKKDASLSFFDAAEWMFLLTGGVSLDNPHSNPCGDWLQPKQWNELCLLSDLASARGLRESFADAATQAAWKRVSDSEKPQDAAFPGEWQDRLGGLRRLCLLRCIRPDKVVLATQNFVVENQGEAFVRPPPFDLEACYDESVCTTPLVFVLSPGSDPMGAVLTASQLLKRRVSPMSLGQGQGPLAEKLIATSCKDGSWVVLQNCHLAPSFMPRLEQICEGLRPENTHKDFRLWCTTYPSPVFPVSVLQNGVKMTIEPPKGLRANLVGSFSNAPLSDSGYLDSCTKKDPFCKLVYALCVFHALLQERRLFGPLGWNIAYGFNESDLFISMQQLAMFLDENDEVPFKALKYCIGECNYGGRVTDAQDRRTLTCILDRFFGPHVLAAATPKLSDSGVYVMPSAGTHADFMAHIEALPLVAEPEIFGFHDNANITKSTKETNELFETILLTEGGGGRSSAGGGGGGDEALSATAREILHKLPAEEFDMELAMLRYPVKWSESMNTVLTQELLRFNRLTQTIKASLRALQNAVKGVVVMSSDLERLGTALQLGAIPAMWKARSYPSFKPLASYVNDLLRRLDFFASWVNTAPPPSYWLSALFFQHAFLTASKQNFARRETIPIDAIGFKFIMLPAANKKPGRAADNNNALAPSLGVHTYGLFFEGARWDVAHIAESEPKQLFAPAPLMWLKPMRAELIEHPDSYFCPVYKTSDRRGVLATTGHSTNFIIEIPMPSKKTTAHWVQRGVALLTQLDD